MDWKNRIIQHGVKPASEFLANPNNPRIHPPEQREAVKGSLNALGWIAPVIELASGELLDGHERIWQALSKGDETPVPYIVVDLNEDEAKLALTTFDYITTLAEYDKDILSQLMASINTDDAALQSVIGQMAEEFEVVTFDNPNPAEDSKYTNEIKIPTYTPSEQKPKLEELYSQDKTRGLITEIEQSTELTPAEKEFLIAAAQRHTVFNFSKVADYYAHSSPAVQRLMENSALVIIDFNRAIELGFVKLTQRLSELYSEEYGDSE